MCNERRRAQALIELIRQAHTGTGTAALVEMLVLIDYQTLLGQLAQHGVCQLGDRTPIPADAARQMACEARIIPVTLTGPSVALDVGRAARTATSAQKPPYGRYTTPAVSKTATSRSGTARYITSNGGKTKATPTSPTWPRSVQNTTTSSTTTTGNSPSTRTGSQPSTATTRRQGCHPRPPNPSTPNVTLNHSPNRPNTPAKTRLATGPPTANRSPKTPPPPCAAENPNQRTDPEGSSLPNHHRPTTPSPHPTSGAAKPASETRPTPRTTATQPHPT
jgi:hypothetical protein